MYQTMLNKESEQETEQLNELLEKQNKARLPNEIRRVYSEAIKKEELNKLNDYGWKVLNEIPDKTEEEIAEMSGQDFNQYTAIQKGIADLKEARDQRIKNETEKAVFEKRAETIKAKEFVAKERSEMSLKEQLEINATIDNTIQGQI
jgi:hypothetical protein